METEFMTVGELRRLLAKHADDALIAVTVKSEDRMMLKTDVREATLGEMMVEEDVTNHDPETTVIIITTWD